MFKFLKGASAARQTAVDQFNGTVSKLKRSDETVQVAVGHGINTASSFFFKRFSSVEEFRGIPRKEQMKYVETLAKTTKGVYEKNQAMGIGFDLYKMWLVAVMQKDQELGDKFSKELKWLSEKGDLQGP